MQPARELINFDQWIFWKSLIREGKATKVPCSVSGRPVSVTDPSAWHTYQDAIDGLRDVGQANKLAGVGFCFTPEDPFVGIDLDGCWPRLSPAAKEILGLFPTYTEVSPSGTGVKIFAQGSIDGYKRNRTAEVPGFAQLEVYDRDRFFTVTGQRVGIFGEGVVACHDSIRWLMETYLPNPQPAAAPAHSTGTGAGALEGDDAALLELMFGFANGEQARRLWGGDMSRYLDVDGKPNHSSADMGLLGYLTFVVGPDPDRIDHLFRQSALMRDKWDERRGATTYGERSIARAVEQATEFYTPPRAPDAELSAWADDLAGGSGTLPGASDVPAIQVAGQTPPAAPASQDENETGEGGVEVAPLHDGATAPSGSPSAASFPIPDRGLIRDAVDLIGPRTMVPDETLALSMLVMMSAVTGWARWIKWGESVEPSILYAVIVAITASGKSTGVYSVNSLWNEAGIDVGMTTQHASGRAILEAAMGGIEIFQVKPQKVPIDADPETVLTIETENMDLEARKAEKLDNPPPIVLVWDEFGTMLDVKGRWQEDTRAQLLQMYNGKHSGIKTTGRDGVKVPGGKTSMAMLGTMTTDQLSRALDLGQVGDGLLGRILFSPPGVDKPPMPFPPDEDVQYLDRKRAVVEGIQAFVARVSHRSYSAYDGWTPGAKTAYADWFAAQHEATKDQPLQGAMFKRGQTIAVKIAALLACAEDSGWDQTDAGITVVEEHHARQAIAIVEASFAVALEAVQTQIFSQRDRWCDAAVELLTDSGPISQWELTRRSLIAKEPGDRTIEQHTRAEWVASDPRMVLDKTNNRGFVVKLA